MRPLRPAHRPKPLDRVIILPARSTFKSLSKASFCKPSFVRRRYPPVYARRTALIARGLTLTAATPASRNCRI